jgi:hypothetical protein
MADLPIVKLTTSTGHTWQTNVSAQTTEAEAMEYFLGQQFDVSSDPDTEKIETVVKVEFIAPAAQFS